MANLYKLLEKIRELDNCELSNPILDTEIDYTLPSAYLDILRLFNGGEIFLPGTVIYGIGNDSKFPFFKSANYGDIHKARSIPNSLLIIGQVNYGDLICIEKDVPNKIFLWDINEHTISYQWTDFSQLLEEEIEDYLLYLEDTKNE